MPVPKEWPEDLSLVEFMAGTAQVTKAILELGLKGLSFEMNRCSALIAACLLLSFCYDQVFCWRMIPVSYDVVPFLVHERKPIT